MVLSNKVMNTMNKHIKQISEQAGEYANETWKPRVRSKVLGEIWEEGHVDWFEQYDAKFAELIVRECISKIENEAEQYAAPVWAVELVNDIKDSFGIAE